MKRVFVVAIAIALLATPAIGIAASPNGEQYCKHQELWKANPPGGTGWVTHDNGCGTVVHVDPIYVI